MKTRSVLPLVCAALLLGASPAAAQIRITGSIAGVVIDSADAVVPGATVTLKDEGTAATKETTTNQSGYFSFPDLNHGNYTVTVALTGFQTAIFSKVAVESGRTTDLRIKLMVGALEQTVTVEGASPILETTSNMISSTLNRKTITELPLVNRDIFTFARLVPGAASPQGGSVHYHGMPGGTINPTIDGVNNSSNGWKSGGTSFFGTVPARLGAMEELTIETTGQGAEAGAMGGVNLKFVTRRGTNQFRASGFWQHFNEFFNANTYGNNRSGIPKNKSRRHDFGGNFGGPLLPGTALRDKLFVFINYEQEYNPETQTRTRTVLKPETEAGILTYRTSTGEIRTANVLDIARNNGFPAALDPTIGRVLAGHRQARNNATLVPTNSLLTESISWREPQQTDQYYPTARLDYQVSPNLAWMGSWNLYSQHRSGARVFPIDGLPPQLDIQTRAWWITSTGLNWSVNPRLHNEFRYGIQHSGDVIPYREARYFEQYHGVLNGKPVRFPNGLPLGINPLVNDASPITGRHYIHTLSDTLTWMQGNHKWTFGTTFRFTNWRDTSFDGPGSGGFLGLPRYTLGLAGGDPVSGIFSTTSMPGIQNADLTNARNLYALLTGRVSLVQTGRVLDPATLQYSDTVYNENWTASKMGGVFAQDQWRMTPNFTLNYGLRYEVTGVPYSKLGNANFPDLANLYGPSTELFRPGQLNGVANPTIVRGKYAAKTDWNNFAPNVGFAWTPMAAEGGLLSMLIGSGADSVLRGSYSLTYYDEGTNMFAFNAGSNPGYGQALRLDPGIGFAPGSLLLQTPLPPFVAFPLQYSEVFRQSDFTFSNGFRTLKNDLQTPYVHSWNIGLQRQIAKGLVVEARYLGTRGENVWRTYNLNEVNIFESNFLEQFKRAQTNLAINQAAGVTSFQNRGLPGQQPIPLFEAAFGGLGSKAPLTTAQGFTNGNFVTDLTNGEAGRMAQRIASNAFYVCRLFGSTFSPCTRPTSELGFDAPGSYPINLFYVNPYAGNQGAWIVDDASQTRYHAMQLQLRQRYTHGLQMTVNYTLGKATNDMWAENSTQEFNYRTLRDKSLNKGPAHYDVRHILQAFGTYDLPFGKDRRFGINNVLLNAALGGWTLGGILTAQSGTPFMLTSGRQTFNQYEAGVILVNGTTVEDLQKAIRWSPGPGNARYWIDPKFIGPDGQANPAFIRAPTEPGQLGQRVILRGKANWNFDTSLNKDFDLPGRANLRLHLTMTNVLNHPIFGTPGWTGNPNITDDEFGQVTNPINAPRRMYLRTEISF